MQYHTPGTGIPCPKCGGTLSKPVTFSWWGGVLGPKMLSHVKCTNCGAGFNGKTGRSNNTAIAIYVIVSGILGLVLVYFFIRR